MHAILAVCLLAFEPGFADQFTPPKVTLGGPVSVLIKRGYFEGVGEKIHEDHQNAQENALYDFKGRRIGLIDMAPLGSKHRFKHLENAAGQVTQTTIYEGGEPQGRELYTYTKKGDLLERRVLDEDGDPVMRVVLNYSPQGRLVMESTYSNKDVLTGKVSYAYDATGSLVKRVTYRAATPLKLVRVEAVDRKGNVGAEADYDEWGGVKDEFIYRYEFSGAFWTKQTKLKKVVLFGKTSYFPVDAIYRIITPIRVKNPQDDHPWGLGKIE